VKAVRGKNETTGEGFEKQIGFKPTVKEWGSYGWAEWWIKRGRSDSEGIGEWEMEELVGLPDYQNEVDEKNVDTFW